jgi:uncharacterized protein involved in tolerance to divalent cations
MQSGFIQIETTFENQEDAERVVKVLLEKNLIACGQWCDIGSAYKWEGQIRKDNEVLLKVKTQDVLYSDCEKIIKENHPYEIPQIVATRYEFGSKEYFDWMGSVLKN